MTFRRFIERFFLIAGILAIAICALLYAASAIYQSWANRAFERKIAASSALSIPKGGQVPLAKAPRLVENGALLGRLAIPRLSIRAMVREGDDDGTLGLALGHIPGTAFPSQDGNVGVAGHRDTLFRGLGSIRKNDVILFETVGGTYRYRVENTRIVDPSNVGVLKKGAYPELTLVTCYPFRYIGSAPDRFIVQARRELEAPAEATNHPPKSRPGRLPH